MKNKLLITSILFISMHSWCNEAETTQFDSAKQAYTECTIIAAGLKTHNPRYTNDGNPVDPKRVFKIPAGWTPISLGGLGQFGGGILICR